MSQKLPSTKSSKHRDQLTVDDPKLPEIVITTPENENIPLFDENMFELFQGNKKIKECLKLVDGFIKGKKGQKGVGEDL